MIDSPVGMSTEGVPLVSLPLQQVKLKALLESIWEVFLDLGAMEEMRKCREAESFKENARRKNQMVKEGERAEAFVEKKKKKKKMREVEK